MLTGIARAPPLPVNILVADDSVGDSCRAVGGAAWLLIKTQSITNIFTLLTVLLENFIL